jgi:hypothetical protein
MREELGAMTAHADAATTLVINDGGDLSDRPIAVRC